MSEVEKTRIEIPTDKYVKAKSASGAVSRHNGDVVASALEGLTIDEVFSLAAEVTEQEESMLREKYSHLNVGQQRMNLGNRIRGVVGKMNRACEKALDAGEEQPHVFGDVFLNQLAEPYRDAVAQREQEAAEAKAAKEAERAAKSAKAEEEAA